MAPNIDELKEIPSTSFIASYFSKKTIFITGVTGFVGKCLLEKLFRSCPGMDKSFS
jgi:FlaA1/EpsC-like NDP-sugar epimerase